MMMWCPGDTLAKIEKRTILEALRFYQGDRKRTAESLGIALRTLYNKMDEYNGKKDQEKGEAKINADANGTITGENTTSVDVPPSIERVDPPIKPKAGKK
jgi:hypothetical protein